MDDIRAADLDLAAMPPETALRLNGQACAVCGTAGPLQPGGWAYAVHPGNGGRLGYRVGICVRCPKNAERSSS